MSRAQGERPREHRAAAALLADAAARARTGAGGLVLLRGATGTGRTTVLESAAESAAAQGMRVLRARCAPADTAVPFAAALQLLGAVPEFEQAEPADREREFGAVLQRTLDAYAEESPLLVAVDDVHLADAPSYRWLVETARHVDRLALPILLAVTERSQYDVDPPAPGFTHTLSPALVRTHTLAPLTAESAAGLVRAEFPGAPEQWIDSCARAGGGSPLLLRALLDDLAASGRRPTVPETCAALYPGEYPAAVSWWLDSAGPGTTEVARALAVLDEGWDRKEEGTGRAFDGFGDDWNLPRRSDPGVDEAWNPGTGADTPWGQTRRSGVDAGGLGEWMRRSGVDAGGLGEWMRRSGVDAGGLGERTRRSDTGAGGPWEAEPAEAGGSVDGAWDRGPVGAADRGFPDLGDGWDHGRAGAVDRAVTGVVPGLAGRPLDRAPERLGALLAELAGADPARVAGWLTAMTGLGLLRPDPVGRPRYAHPLLRDAVLTGVPVARRRAAHRTAAETMLHHGAPTEPVARQLLLSDPVAAPWASTVLQDAASLALRDDRAEDAVAFLRRALDEPLSDGRRQRLLTELGSLEVAGRRSSAGIPRLTEALRLPGTPQDRVRAAVALGTALAGRGRPRAAVEALRAVGEQLADRPDLAATLQSAAALLSDQDQTIRREVYRELCGTAEHTPELLGPATRTLLVRYAATAGLTSAAEAMHRVRALLAEPADPLTEPFLLGTAAAVAQWADELDEAERLVERGLAGQRPGLLHPMHQALLNTRDDIAAARGEFGRLPAEPPVLPDTGPSNAHAHVLLTLVETGRTTEAQRLADGFDLREAPDSWELNRFLYARGVQRAAAGDPAGALHDFLECGRRQSAREVVSPIVTPWRSAAAECRSALGSLREALALAEEELRLAREWGTPRTVGRALRTLGTVTGGRRGLELTEEAVRLLRAAPAVAEPELVAALLAQGRLLTAAGERGRARECLREAAERAERLGALRLRTLAEEALREGGARRPALARTGSRSLTGSELRIARLAADGRTNTEIAGLLHLARRTVETHLTSAYKKLGIRRRGELRGALGAD